MPTERDKAEIEQIMQMPEAERQALMGRMSAACDEIESTLDRIRRDPRSNRLLSELDQVKANVRDNPDSIPEVAAVFGCSEDDVREWIAGSDPSSKLRDLLGELIWSEDDALTPDRELLHQAQPRLTGIPYETKSEQVIDDGDAFYHVFEEFVVCHSWPGQTGIYRRKAVDCPRTVDCDKCGGTGFTGKGTGYGDICGNCVAGKIPAKD